MTDVAALLDPAGLAKLHIGTVRTLHQGSRLVGTLSYHTDDHILVGDKSDPQFLSALETIRGLYDWSSWEEDTFERCGCRVQQKRDGSIEVDQTEHVHATQTSSITAHRRRHQREVLSRREHHQVITERRVHGWLAQHTMIAFMTLLSLNDASELTKR